MDFGLLVHKNYAMKLQEICWVSRIYNKECIKELLVYWTSSKVSFVRNTHGHVIKMPFDASTRRLEDFPNLIYEMP